MTLDDATGTIYSAFLVEEEGTASTFRALNEVFGAHGLPMSLYTDRGAHYFRTAETAGRIDPHDPTQSRVGAEATGGRAYRRLFAAGAGPLRAGVRDASGSAGQGTLAGRDILDRGGQPLHPRGLLPAHNARFAVAPADVGSAFVTIPGVDLDEIPSVEQERQVVNDNCVRYRPLNCRSR